MNVEIDRDDLLSALRIVKPAIHKGLASDATIEAVGDRVSLSAGMGTMVVGVSVNVPATVREEGRVSLPHKVALALVQKMPRLPVRVKNELMPDHDGAVEIACGIGEYRLTPTVVSGDPPAPVFPEFTIVGTYPAAEFINAFRTAAAFASTDGLRPMLNNVLLEGDGSTLEVVGTDGHRMAVSELRTEFPAAPEHFRLTAYRLLSAVFAASLKGADEVEVSVGLNYSRFRWGRVTGVLCTMEDRYPDWKQVLPSKSDKMWEVSRADLLATGNRMLVMANRTDKRVHVSFNGKTGAVETRHSDAREVVGGTYVGDDFRFAVNALYLTDLLKRIPSPNVRFQFTTPESAILVDGIGDSNEPKPLTQRFLLMPLRILEG